MLFRSGKAIVLTDDERTLLSQWARGIKMVHPGLVWVEAEASAVEEDGGFEVLSVPEATDSSFDGRDFAVHSFGDGNLILWVQ